LTQKAKLGRERSEPRYTFRLWKSHEIKKLFQKEKRKKTGKTNGKKANRPKKPKWGHPSEPVMKKLAKKESL